MKLIISNIKNINLKIKIKTLQILICLSKQITKKIEIQL